MSGKRSVLCSVFCVLTGGEEKGQGMTNSLIFLIPTPTPTPTFLSLSLV